MAHIYKVIIIGASEAGIALANKLKTEERTVLLISKDFRKLRNKNKLATEIDMLTAEAIHLTYARGLFGVGVRQADTDGTVYGLKVVFATGSKPIQSALKTKNIFYSISEIKGKHNNEAILVYGNNDYAVSAAISLSKQFCKVYLGTEELNLACTATLKTNLSKLQNVLHLPKCRLQNFRQNKAAKLTGVTLDAYGTITVSALLYSIGRLPDIPSFAKRFLKVSADGFADVSADFESTLVPGVFAIGDLCPAFSKQDLEKIASAILD